jgi:hypothetical protein
MFRDAQLARCLALGLMVVSNAVFSHQTRGGAGDTGPDTGCLARFFVTGHVGSIKVKSNLF